MVSIACGSTTEVCRNSSGRCFGSEMCTSTSGAVSWAQASQIGQRVVRPRAGVEDHGQVEVGRLVEPVEHRALVVGLPDLDLEAELLAPRLAQVGQLGVGRGAVDLRLPLAEPTEVGSVEDEDDHDVPPIAEYAARRSSSDGPARIRGSADVVEHHEAQLVAAGLLVDLHRVVQVLEGGVGVGGRQADAARRRRGAARPARGSREPARAASSATYTEPIATASPCRTA